MADTATGIYVEPERRLTVRAGRHEVVLAASAEEEGAEAGHGIAALVFEGHGCAMVRSVGRVGLEPTTDGL